MTPSIRTSARHSPAGECRNARARYPLWLLGCLLCVQFALARADEVSAGPYVPTPQYIVDRMLRMAGVSASDYVIDLGSGDGRIVITAARQFGARGMGVDISEKLVDLAITNSHKERVAEKVRFVREDAFKTDIRPATVLTLYLLPRFVLELRPKLLAELRPGSRIVSHDYSLGDWSADNAVTFDTPEKEPINGSTQTTLFLYIVPARVAGTWQFSLPEAVGRRGAQVTLKQSYQQVSGSFGGQPLKHVALRGDRIELLLPLATAQHLVVAQVNGSRMSGSMELGGRKLPVSAMRIAEGRAGGWP